MHIRKSKERDRKAILRMAKAYSNDIGLQDKRGRFEEHIGTDKVIVACDDGDKAVGFVYAYLKGAGHHLYKPGRKELYVSALCVNAANQRQGVGNMLLGELVVSNEHRNIVGSVYGTNVAGLGLYKKNGFVEDGAVVRMSHKGVRNDMLLATYHLRPFEIKADAESKPLADKPSADKPSADAVIAAGLKKDAIQSPVRTQQDYGELPPDAKTEGKAEGKAEGANRIVEKMRKLDEASVNASIDEASLLSKYEQRLVEVADDYNSGMKGHGIGFNEEAIRAEKIVLEEIVRDLKAAGSNEGSSSDAKTEGANRIVEKMRKLDEASFEEAPNIWADKLDRLRALRDPEHLVRKVKALDINKVDESKENREVAQDQVEVMEEQDRLNTAPIRSPEIDRIDGTEDGVALGEEIPKNLTDVERLQDGVTDFKPLSGGDDRPVAVPEATTPQEVPTESTPREDQLDVGSYEVSEDAQEPANAAQWETEKNDEAYPKHPAPQMPPLDNTSGSSHGSKKTDEIKKVSELGVGVGGSMAFNKDYVKDEQQ